MDISRSSSSRNEKSKCITCSFFNLTSKNTENNNEPQKNTGDNIGKKHYDVPTLLKIKTYITLVVANIKGKISLISGNELGL